MIDYEVAWNNANRKKLKELENNLSQCHFAHHKSHMDLPAWWEVSIQPTEQWYGCISCYYWYSGHKELFW